MLNRAAVMAVCTLLAARTIDLSGSDGCRRIGAVEDAHLRLNKV